MPQVLALSGSTRIPEDIQPVESVDKIDQAVVVDEYVVALGEFEACDRFWNIVSNFSGFVGV